MQCERMLGLGRPDYALIGMTRMKKFRKYLAGLACIVACAGFPSVHAQTVVEYIHTDALGTPIAVTDANRNVIERSEYEPYGQLLNRPMTDGPGFTGHVQDAATGMTYMQQRYYDPLVGRFMSVDPITAFQDPTDSFNRYRYGNDNPYRFYDPDGRKAKAEEECPKQPCEEDQRSRRERQEERERKNRQALGWTFVSNVNHSKVGGAWKIDEKTWKLTATVYENRVEVDSAGPIMVQPGSVAGPLPTYQFYFSLRQHPLAREGRLEPSMGPASWSEPITYGSGGTGAYDRAGYLFVPRPARGDGGTRWYIEIKSGPSTHDNAAHPYLNIYVPRTR